MKWLRKWFRKRPAPVVPSANVRHFRPRLEELEGRELPAVATPYLITEPYTNTSSSAPYTPAQIDSAYGINSINFSGVAGNGAGQTIAIIGAYNNPDVAGDLATFDSTFGLAAPPSFKIVNQNGQTSSLPANDTSGLWSLEAALDVEWAHAIAPAANIVLVEASSSNTSDLFAAISTATRMSGVSVISMSWGVQGGFSSEASLDSYFNVSGITFVASTGDNGSPGSYPAESPYVVAVGGTTLTISGSGYGGETAWSGSGGGVSSYEGEPGYQYGVGSVTGSRRGTPDVSFDANPSTGVYVYDSYDASRYGGAWIQVGGTSLGAPCWAGLLAIADQGRALSGLGSLSSAQTLQALYSLPSSDFHDIVSGSNGSYSAGPGYDLVTGIGSPIANLLIPGLAGANTGGSSGGGSGSNGGGSGGSTGGDSGGGQSAGTITYDVVDIPGQGVYRYSSATGWQLLTGAQASSVAVDAYGDVIGEFPDYYGVWLYRDSTGWVNLTQADASIVSIAGNCVIAAEFPSYMGVWRYQSSTGWQNLTGADASSLAVDASGDVVGEFPNFNGVWLYYNSTGWAHLTGADASVVSISGDAIVAAVFPNFNGVWRYEASTNWMNLSQSVAATISVNAAGDVAIDLPNYRGVWLYQDSTGWTNFYSGNATQVAIGSDDTILAEIPGSGVWTHTTSAGWQRLTSTDASEIGLGS